MSYIKAITQSLVVNLTPTIISAVTKGTQTQLELKEERSFNLNDEIKITGSSGLLIDGLYKVAQVISNRIIKIFLDTSALAGSYTANSASIYTNRDEYYRDHTIAIDCVELHLKDNSGNDAPIYLSNGGADLAFDSDTAPDSGNNTYESQGNFLGFSPLSQDFDVKVGKFSIYLSGLNNSYIQNLIDYEIEGKRVVLYKAFLNFGSTGEDPLALVAKPKLMFDGVIYNFSISEASNSCQITIDCSSLFADFERLNGRKTNNWSNWLFQGQNKDKAFEKAGYVGQTEFKWGRK